MSKCVVIGVTGGIAVYKALDVISALRKKDIEVHVIMTESASKFVNPLTFQSISQNMVVTDMFAETIKRVMNNESISSQYII